MKNLLLITILLSSLFSSCDFDPNPNNKVIVSKAFSLEPKKSLQPCICMYEFYFRSNPMHFEDSCNKYNIGDTIK